MHDFQIGVFACSQDCVVKHCESARATLAHLEKHTKTFVQQLQLQMGVKQNYVLPVEANTSKTKGKRKAVSSDTPYEDALHASQDIIDEVSEKQATLGLSGGSQIVEDVDLLSSTLNDSSLLEDLDEALTTRKFLTDVSRYTQSKLA